jgi:chloramphenicol 3-O phosphotransferase
MARIIFLHGASSSGKSTIAKALQARIEAPFWHVSIDHLRDSGVLPLDRFRTGEFAWAEARDAFFNGFHASVAAYADAGNDLILEHILDTGGWLETLRDLLAAHDVFFVAVHCPLDVLLGREKRRGDRPAGSAMRDFQTIHVGKSYDLRVDGTHDVDANVERILVTWRCSTRRSDFSFRKDPG